MRPPGSGRGGPNTEAWGGQSEDGERGRSRNVGGKDYVVTWSPEETALVEPPLRPEKEPLDLVMKLP